MWEASGKNVWCKNGKYLFSVIMAVMFLYIGIGTWSPLITYRMTFWFPNKVLMTYSFIFSTVLLVGVRNKVWGLANIFTLTFPLWYCHHKDTRGRFYLRVVTVYVLVFQPWTMLNHVRKIYYSNDVAILYKGRE